MTAEITKALCQFMADVPPLVKLSTAKVPTKNGKSFSFEYAELGYICSVINPILAINGLHVMHTNRVVDGVDHLVTTILHTSGESISSEVQIPAGINVNKLYSFGSACTYYRRYVTLGILNLWHGCDDAGKLFEPDFADTEIQTTNPISTNANPEGSVDKSLADACIKTITTKYNQLQDGKQWYLSVQKRFQDKFGIALTGNSITKEKHIEFLMNIVNQGAVAV